MKVHFAILPGILLQLLNCSPSVGAGFPVATSVNPYALSVAADGNGDFVVVWDNDTGGGSDVYARLFQKGGSARGAAFQVNTFTNGSQNGPVAAMDADGDFLVVWQSDAQDGSGLGVFGRRFSIRGDPLGDEFQVNTSASGDQSNPRVAVNAAGESVVVWENNGIWARRYSADGIAISGEFRVDSPTTSAIRYPAVALDSTGGFVIVWERSEGGFSRSVKGQRYSGTGTAVGGEITIGTSSFSTFPRVAMDLVGDFIVTWKSTAITKARLFDTHGVPKGSDFTVHTGDSNPLPDVIMPANVSADVDGDFAVTWEAYSSANSSHLTYCQRYNKTGTAVGSREVLSPGGPFPDISADAQGDMIVASKAGGGIFAEYFPGAGDDAGPLVTDVMLGGRRLTEGDRVTEAVAQLVVCFSEEIDSTAGGMNSVVNAANWVLLREGQELVGGISGVTFGFNTNTLKYEAVVTLDGNGAATGTVPLSDGNYTLTILDFVADLAGNPLDGNFNGTPGGDFSRSFVIADPLNHWHWRTSQPSTNALWGVGYGNGVFVAVGDNGALLSSSDAVFWARRDSGTLADLSAVTCANGLFVAVGSSYDSSNGYRAAIVTSTDAINWTPRTTGVTNWLDGVIYGNGQFVAAGGGGTILTSSDGLSWAAHNAGTNASLYDIAYGNGRFVAVGMDWVTDPNRGYGVIVSSSDGVNWTSNPSATNAEPLGITFGGGMFVVVTLNYSDVTFTSSDGINWTNHPAPGNFLDVTFGNGLYVGSGPSAVYTSANGYDWTRHTVDSDSQELRGITYGNGVFVAVGRYSYLETIIVSQDGTNWTLPNSLRVRDLAHAAYGNGAFVALGTDGTVMTSSNGANWSYGVAFTNGITTNASLLPSNLRLTYANGLFVGVGSSYNIVISPNGISWASLASGESDYLDRVIYGNGHYVAVGGNGSITTSDDGTNWSPKVSGTTSYLHAAAFGGSLFVAVGRSGKILTSTNATNWVSRTSGTTREFYGATYGSGAFVAVGGNSPNTIVLTSTNGVNWRDAAVGGTNGLNDVTYGNNAFVAVGPRGTIVSSGDLTNWVYRSSGVTDDINAITFTSGLFVAACNRGMLLSSPDGITWTLRNSGLDEDLTGIAYGPSGFLTVGYYGSILTSTNGTFWKFLSHRNPNSFTIGALTYANGMFMAVTSMGTVLTSADGADWVTLDTGTTAALSGICYGGGKYVCVGYHGTILTSPDGVTWSLINSGTRPNLVGVCSGAGRFVAIGQDDTHYPYRPVILASSDGISWASSIPPTTNLLSAVVYGGGTFVAAGDKGTIVSSTDGVNWMARSSGTFDNLTDITYGDGLFVAVGGMLLTSADGVSWTSRPLDGSIRGQGICYGSGTFILVGGSQGIVQSDPLIDAGPFIFEQPQSQTTTAGATASFGVGTLGTSPLRYWWLKDGSGITAATNGTLDFVNLRPSDGGVITVVVSNEFGLVTSQPALLVVKQPEISASSKLGFHLIISGAPGRAYRVEYNEDLNLSSNWQALTNISLSTAQETVFDPQSLSASRRFYRVVLLP